MKLFSDFREFVARGNVLDLAVGVILGGAFGKIVTSLVNDLVMPPIGFLLQRVNVRDLELVLVRDAEGAPVVSIGYGNFLQNIFEFLIIALAVFLLVQAITRLRRTQKPEPAVPPAPREDLALLREIRDALQK
jgi:large conductance mechanosensitive channel